MATFRAMHFREDFILRSIQQLVEFIARALKLKNPEETIELLEAASGKALGVELDVLMMLDAKSALELLGTTERALAFVQLLDALVEAELRAGHAEASARYELRASDLRAALSASRRA